jgi:hypothetical protein
MRTVVLAVAVAIVGACLFVSWAKADVGGATAAAGLRSVTTCEQGDCQSRDLRDVDKIDRTGEVEGALATYALGFAALAMLIAALILRGGPMITSMRAIFALPCAAALAATIAFASRLSHVSWMHLTWAPYAAALACAAGAIAILWRDQHRVG